MKFRPILDALEDRKLLSFGGGNIDTSIPRLPTTSPQLNFTSNSFHNINATIPSVATSILSNASSTNTQLSTYVTHIPYGESTLLPILEADVSKFEAGGTGSLTTTQANFIVTTLYNDLLFRAPDSIGLANFSAALQNGMTMAQVANSLVTSQEYIQNNIASGQTPNAAQTQFVDALYRDVLGRSADVGGETFWVNQLNTGGLTVQQVATDFVNSQEAATSKTSILATPIITATGPNYYYGSVVPNGTITGNFPGTSQTAQLENLIQQDTLAYLGNGIGKNFNILKSGVNFSSDKLLTYNGHV